MDFPAYYITLYYSPYLLCKDPWLAKASLRGLDFPMPVNRSQSRFRSVVCKMLKTSNMFPTQAFNGLFWRPEKNTICHFWALYWKAPIDLNWLQCSSHWDILTLPQIKAFLPQYLFHHYFTIVECGFRFQVNVFLSVMSPPYQMFLEVTATSLYYMILTTSTVPNSWSSSLQPNKLYFTYDLKLAALVSSTV